MYIYIQKAASTLIGDLEIEAGRVDVGSPGEIWFLAALLMRFACNILPDSLVCRDTPVR